MPTHPTSPLSRGASIHSSYHTPVGQGIASRPPGAPLRRRRAVVHTTNTFPNGATSPNGVEHTTVGMAEDHNGAPAARDLVQAFANVLAVEQSD